MTTEDDFQTALDADPTDWQTRLVFADWLQERDDPRADGYRALGALRLWPATSKFHERGKVCHGYTNPTNAIYDFSHARVNQDWWDAISGSISDAEANPSWRWFPTRREADDAAARAFAKLPAELLSGVPT